MKVTVGDKRFDYDFQFEFVNIRLVSSNILNKC